MASLPLPKAYFIANDYLLFDAQNEKRYEYYRGEVVAMAGASLTLAQIYEQIEFEESDPPTS
jgi:hypothetical protein